MVSLLLSVQNCLRLIFSQVSLWVRRGHHGTSQKNEILNHSNSPNNPKVRERGLSLREKRVEISLRFFSFRLRCNPKVQDVDEVRFYTHLETNHRAQASTHLSYRFWYFAPTALEFSATALS